MATYGFNDAIASLAAKYKASNGVISAIQTAAQKTGVDFKFLLDKAATESSLNPNAKAKSSSATGLFQFIDSTWLKMVKDHGADYGLDKEAAAIDDNGKVADADTKKQILSLRCDPTISACMAAEFTKENKAHLEASTGNAAGKTELYMAHFMGAGGASKFLNAMDKTPETKAASLFPREAAANHGVFYGKDGHSLTLKQVYNHFAAKFDEGSAVKDVVAKQSLPTSPAWALAVADRGQMNSVTHLPTALAALDMQMTAVPSAALTTINNATAQQMAWLTQSVLSQMNVASPTMVWDLDKQAPQKVAAAF